MKYFSAAFFVLLSSFSLFGQNSATYSSCIKQANTQTEMNVCANKEAVRADTELNRTYHELLSKATSQPDAVEKIKACERAWITYRDAYMEAMYPAKDKQAEYGSIYSMELDLRRAKVTQQHVNALKDPIEQYGAGH